MLLVVIKSPLNHSMNSPVPSFPSKDVFPDSFMIGHAKSLMLKGILIIASSTSSPSTYPGTMGFGFINPFPELTRLIEFVESVELV